MGGPEGPRAGTRAHLCPLQEVIMPIRSVDDLDVGGKKVLVRADFNVPLDDEGRVGDETRIVASLATVRALISRGARVILMSHLGRPKGKRVDSLSLAPIGELLKKHLGAGVAFAEDCIGLPAQEVAGSLEDGGVALLENLRFHEGEESDSVDFASKLAELGEVYVNDAFGTAHRAHASTDAVPRMMKQKGAGFLMLKELDYLSRALQKPEKPFVAVLGGAKISGKIDIITNMLPRVDRLLVGGGMMYTFLKARGLSIGLSLLDEDRVKMAADVLQKADGEGKAIVLPKDCLVSDKVKEAGATRIVNVDEIPDDRYGVDIGPATLSEFGEVIRGAKTVLWNGPMGVFEVDEYSAGTSGVAHAVADATAAGAISLVGGGDSVAALAKAGVTSKISHVSTGGGASLEFLAGKTLPGVAALEC
jgi:phosphoglycerate kinase